MATENKTTTKPEFDTITPEEVVQHILESANTHAIATDMLMSSLVFFDKTLSEWAAHLAVYVPDDMGPLTLRSLHIKCARNVQQAVTLYSYSNSIYNAISNGGNLRKSDLTAAIVEWYRSNNSTRPAGTIIDRMADSYMNDTINTRIAAKIVREFFRDQKDTLLEVRKHLEQIGYTMHLEVKLGEES